MKVLSRMPALFTQGLVDRAINQAAEGKITLRCKVCRRVIDIPADSKELPRCWHGKTTWDYIPYAVTIATDGGSKIKQLNKE